jgi:serine/threonine-protein kinase BUR1
MADRREDKLLGKILFKHYKLKKKIGEGSFGKIYIGIHNETKVEYAIKLVSKILININKNIKIINKINNNIKYRYYY